MICSNHSKSGKKSSSFKHFWKLLLLWVEKFNFFKKKITISKIWPERFYIWTHWSPRSKGLIIASNLRLEKFEASRSKSGFSSTKAASSYMKHEKMIFVADFEFLKNFSKMFLGVMYVWNWSFGTLETLQDPFHIIVKHIRRI